MKNLFLLLVLNLICFSFVRAQFSVVLPEISATPGSTINVPVRLVGASSTGTPISGANVQITYNASVLTYVNIVNFNSSTPQNQWFFSGNNGIVAANWIEPNLLTVPIQDSASLFEIQFTYTGGSSDLTFTVNEFTDALYNLIPTLAVNGYVHPLPQPYTLTLNVDMSRQSVSADGVHVAGSFNGWNPTTTAMLAGANSVYSVSISVIEGQECQYRFVNGNSMSGMEIVPASCGTPNGSGLFNRFISMPSNNTVLDTVCFAMCSRCPVDVPVTFVVDMSNQTVSPNGVHLAGTFNSWNTSTTPMTAGANSIYSATVLLTPGQFHAYRFVNGNTPTDYETVPSECGSPSTLGGFDRYVVVPESDSTLAQVCFGSCVDCGSTAEYVDVTFKVDMQNEMVFGEGVHIAGSFQGWQPGTTIMTSNGDTTYTYTQSFLAGSIIHFKYVNGNSASGYETVPSSCSENGERMLLVPSADTILPLICFSSCEACPNTPFVSVTFRVDMSLADISTLGVHLAGSFQGWDPSSLPMIQGTDNVYSLTLQLPSNVTHEFRYINGNTWGDAEVVPASCALNGNRSILTLMDTIIDITCFSKCGICGIGLNELPALDFNVVVLPNPFENTLGLRTFIPESGRVKIMLFNNIGKLEATICNKSLSKGEYMVEYNSEALSPGIYYYQVLLETGGKSRLISGKIIRK
ncbi:MAG: hypothetical protein IPH88_10025 [Bacteroidales bacterium]|nr:hypothetical protein [Bacteroidales bacterium]